MAFSSENASYEDRRRWPRLNAYSPVKFRCINEDKFQCCITCDISEGGAGVLLDHPVPRGTCLYFQIKLHNCPRPAYGIARVVWTDRDNYSDKYRTGLEFLEISSTSRTDIASFVQTGITPPHPS